MNNNKVKINYKSIETKYSAYRLTSMLLKFSDESEYKKAYTLPMSFGNFNENEDCYLNIYLDNFCFIRYNEY